MERIFSWEEKEGIKFLYFKKLGSLGMVRHGVSTRLGGMSSPPYESLNLGLSTGDKRETVLLNREKFFRILGIKGEDLVTGEQVHSSLFSLVREKGESPLPRTDSLITDKPHIPLGIFTADCLPIFLLAPNHPAIALIHAGRKGTSMGIARNTLKCMKNLLGVAPEECMAFLGPAIGPCCYPVDLWEENKIQLQEMGLKDITILRLCTSHHPELFFSYRRDGSRTGRMMAVIQLET